MMKILRARRKRHDGAAWPYGAKYHPVDGRYAGAFFLASGSRFVALRSGVPCARENP
jgi:hypothetical protein